LYRLRHGLACNDARGDLLDLIGELCVNWAFAVDRLAEGIDDTTNQFGADGHFENAPGRLDGIAFGDMFVFAEHDRANRIAFEVERQAERIAGKFQHFALHRVRQAMDAADAVSDRYDRAFVARGCSKLQVLYPALDQVTDLRGVKLHSITPGS